MEFKEKIKALGEKVEQLKDTIKTEEATKTAFIMPFMTALGYDVFNPIEVIPEYTADLGIKKGEKVDYCIVKDGIPIIIMECKHWKENLIDHDNIIHRYFYATSTKFAILTNGIKYQFYTDSEETNKMDSNPFWEFEINSMTMQDIEQLEEYKKENFDNEKIFGRAIDQKIRGQIIKIIKKELLDPSDEFIKFFSRQIHTGSLTKKLIDQHKVIIKKTLNQLFSETNQEKSSIENFQTTRDNFEPLVNIHNEVNIGTPQKIKINGESFQISLSLEILINTAEWLIRNKSLKPSNYPIITGRHRNLINNIPKHRNNDEFRAPKKLSNGLFIETSYSTAQAIKEARKLLENFGYKGDILEV